MVNMNMIVNASDLVGYEAENKTSKGTQKEMLAKLVAVWEKRNSKQAKKIGAFGLLAVSLAACNSDDDASASADLAAQLAAAQAAQAAAETAQAAAEAAQAAVEAASTAAAAVATAAPVVAAITTLTASIDTVTPAATSDAITAGIVGTTQTWQSLDNIDMGEGNDTITAILTGSVTPNLANVENVIASVSATGIVVDLSGSTGVTNVSSVSSTEVMSFSSLTVGTEMTITNNANDGATFNYVTAGLLGTADVATLNLSNVTGGAGSVVTITDGFETLNVVSTGSVTNSFALTTLTPATINVTGSAATSFAGTLPTTVTAFDASGSTGATTATHNTAVANAYTGSSGADTLTLTGGTTAVSTINLGAGNDKVTFSADLLNTSVAVTDTVVGGDGTDTLTGVRAELQALVNTTLIPSGISEFENLVMSDALTATTLTTSSVQTGGFTSIDLATGTTGAGTLNVGTGTQAVTFGNLLGATLVINDDAIATTNVTTDDVLNLSSSTTAAENLGDILADRQLTITGFETININTTSLGASNTAQDLGIISLTVDTGGTGVVNFTGAEALNVNGAPAGVSTLDFSGMTAQTVGTNTVDMDTGGVITPEAPGSAGSITITGSPGDDLLNGDTDEANTIDSGLGNDDITGGSSNDTLSGGGGNDVIGGGNGNDTLNGGAGNDTLTGGTGNDAINGGDGNDTLNAGAATADVVDGGAGNDIVIISHATDNMSAFDTYSGGAGTDTLRFANATPVTENAANFSSASGFEIFHPVHATAGGAVAYAMSNFINNNLFEQFVFDDQNAKTITISNAPASMNTINVMDGAAGDTLVFTRLVDSAADAMTVNIATTAATTTSVLTAANEETVTFTATLAANDINFANATLSDATSVIVTGLGDVGVAAALTSSTLLTSFDSSGSTGAVEFHATGLTGGVTAIGGTGGLEFTGGLRADTLTGASAVDTFIGGAGADTLNGLGAADNLTGGAGNDIINGGAGADQITGGVGTDTMTGGGADGAADNFIFAVTDYGATIALADVITDFVTADDVITTAQGANAQIVNGVAFADLAALVTDAGNKMVATAGDEIMAYYNALGTGDTYVLVNLDGNDAWAAANDGLIVMTGINLVTEIVLADFA